MRLMRRTERGFTLVELMITIAIIGILSAIAIPTFIGFMSKGKKVEATLALDKMTKNIRVYHAEKRTLPPSTNVMPVRRSAAIGEGVPAPFISLLTTTVPNHTAPA